MLILTRQMGQEICIGDEITIKILNLNKYGIEIGIVAPRHISVVRREIKEKFLNLKNKICGKTI